jgi:hypothetical protein
VIFTKWGAIGLNSARIFSKHLFCKIVRLNKKARNPCGDNIMDDFSPSSCGLGIHFVCLQFLEIEIGPTDSFHPDLLVEL